MEKKKVCFFESVIYRIVNQRNFVQMVEIEKSVDITEFADFVVGSVKFLQTA